MQWKKECAESLCTGWAAFSFTDQGGADQPCLGHNPQQRHSPRHLLLVERGIGRGGQQPTHTKSRLLIISCPLLHCGGEKKEKIYIYGSDAIHSRLCSPWFFIYIYFFLRLKTHGCELLCWSLRRMTHTKRLSHTLGLDNTALLRRLSVKWAGNLSAYTPKRRLCPCRPIEFASTSRQTPTHEAGSSRNAASLGVAGNLPTPPV